jgi:glycosidase
MLSGYGRLQDTLPAYRYSPFLSNHDGTRVMTLLGGDVARMREAATLLLTLPGVPFVYYGEEIGMVGDKPDPRLRTPMQWAPRPGYGFTTASPWEPAQPDSLTTTVAAQDRDAGSLLNLYRRVIHLRRENAALGSGALLPLGFPERLVGYLRTAPGSKVIVVANLSDTTVSPLSTWVRGTTLTPGMHRTRDLMGGREARPLRVSGAADMQSWQIRGILAPHQVLVLQVEP